MPYEEWLAQLQYLGVPAALAAYLVAMLPSHGTPSWRIRPDGPCQREIVHACLAQCKHPGWHRAVHDDPLLESVETALTDLLASPHMDTPRAAHQPADFIVRRLAGEFEYTLISSALIHGQAESIARLAGWLRQLEDDSPEAYP